MPSAENAQKLEASKAHTAVRSKEHELGRKLETVSAAPPVNAVRRHGPHKKILNL